MAIAEKLEYLNDTKQAIKTAIQNRGVTVSDADTFRDYATKIGDIGETVDKKLIGIGIDNIFRISGTTILAASGNIAFDLSGITKLGGSSLFANFMRSGAEEREVSVIANDIAELPAYSFNNFLSGNLYLCPTVVRFDSLTTLTANNVFTGAWKGKAKSNFDVVYSSLKTTSGDYSFQNSFGIYTGAEYVIPAKIFPVLEEISGKSAFSAFCNYVNKTIEFPSIRKITGDTAAYYATFGSGAAGSKWYFPKAVDFTGYIWNFVSTYTGEIHFAAANQADIEACDGYANKWGFQGATIFFDL